MLKIIIFLFQMSLRLKCIPVVLNLADLICQKLKIFTIVISPKLSASRRWCVIPRKKGWAYIDAYRFLDFSPSMACSRWGWERSRSRKRKKTLSTFWTNMCIGIQCRLHLAYRFLFCIYGLQHFVLKSSLKV